MFVMLHMPATGDYLQNMKKGILELTNIMVITKADGELLSKAKLAMSEQKQAFHMAAGKDEWETPVHLVSSLENTGFSEVWQSITDFISYQKKYGHFEQNRESQKLTWFEQELSFQLQKIAEQSRDSESKSILNQLSQKDSYPPEIAKNLIETLLKGL